MRKAGPRPSYEDLLQRVRDLEDQVSDLEAAERALRDREERYRLLAEAATEMILLCDGDGNIVYANPTVFALSGYSKEEVLGRGIERFFDPDEFEQIKSRLKNIPSSTGTLQLCKTAFLHRDGHPIPIEVSSAPIIDHGRAKGILFTARDVSERARMERELQQAKKLESIGVLAGGIAHDYNNLLTALMGYMTLAESLLSTEEEALAHLGRARHAAIMAKNLSRKLITFSKGGKPLKKPGSLLPILENAVSFALAGSNIESELRIPDNLWTTEFDESQLSQAIHNIVTNAREAMPRGGTLYVRAENMHIGERNGHPVDPGDWVKLTIADEGAGIPKRILDRIFDPYFSTKEMGAQKGLGLGLAIAHSVIRNHQGFLSAESESDRGTALHIYLPASSPCSSHTRTETPSAEEEGEKTRVLVMDDEEMVRDITEKMLERCGYEAALARDGDDAVRMFRRCLEEGHPYDVVMLDLTVRGGMGGKETVRALLDIDPSMKAIVSSGYSDDAVMTDFPAYGFQAAITKPYSMGELRDIISRVLGKEDSPAAPQPGSPAPAVQTGQAGRYAQGY